MLEHVKCLGQFNNLLCLNLHNPVMYTVIIPKILISEPTFWMNGLEPCTINLESLSVGEKY